MKVQGVDPVMLNRIQEKVSKQEVQDTRQAALSPDRQRREEQGREQADRDELAAEIVKLNNMAESLGIGLRFALSEDDWSMVLVIEQETRRIIRKLPPEKMFEMLKDMKNFVGMLVDYHL